MILDELALTFVPNLGSRGIVHLMECYNDAADLYAHTDEQLIARAELRGDIARSIARKEGYAEALNLKGAVYECGIYLLAFRTGGCPVVKTVENVTVFILSAIKVCDISLEVRKTLLEESIVTGM